jgi:molecular chaperone GrpE
LRQESAEIDEPTVAQELQKGYRLHERLVRPARVVVAVPAEDGE